MGQDHPRVEGKSFRGPRLFSSSLTPQSSPWLGDGAPAPGAVPSPGFCSWVPFFWLPPQVHLQPPPALETLQSWQLRAVHTGQSRVSGTDVSLGLSLAVTHLVRSEGRAQGNSPQPKYRAGLPGASDVLRCRKATRVAGNLPRESPGKHRQLGDQPPHWVLLQLVQRAGLGSCRAACMCCSGGQELPESCCCCCAEHTMSCLCICGSAHHAGIELPPPAHSIRPGHAVASSSHVPKGSTMARYTRQPWDPAQHSSSQRLWASSVSFPWREKWRGPARPCCATPQCEHCWEWGKVSGQGCLCQMGTVGLGTDRTGHRQGLPECLAERQPPQRAPQAPAQRVSLVVLETCPSVQEPLWGHGPAPLGSGSLHSLHRVCKRPVHSPVLYQAKMQELNEFLKLVLVSAFFFNFPSRQGG